jgi:hypothetical protein
MWRAVHGVVNVLTPAMMRKLPESILNEESACWCYFSKAKSLHIMKQHPSTGRRFRVEITDNVWDDIIACRDFAQFEDALEAIAFVLREGRLP